MTIKPITRVLSDNSIESIVDSAWEVLEKHGVLFDNGEALDFLDGAGFQVDSKSRRVYFMRSPAEFIIRSAPREFLLHDRSGNPASIIGGNRVHFDPGSAAVYWLNPGSLNHRRASVEDSIALARITAMLDSYHIQSTGVVCADVPDDMADYFRLFIALIFNPKPVVTGTFRKESFEIMHQMLGVTLSSPADVRQTPAAVFDCCPSPPLKWSDLTVSALMDCARSGIPAELVSMPLAGATAPVTIHGAVVQHTAESLSGLILHQIVRSGSPIIWGGSPAAFDMRQGTTPMGSMETMMIDMAYAQIGKALNLPTHTYMACSDSKLPDYQAGMETAMGAILAALSGINIVSGPGFLNYENTQSLEKLVLDHDAIRLVERLMEGIRIDHDADAVEIIGRCLTSGSFLSDITTRQIHRREIQSAGKTVNRQTLDQWTASGCNDSRKAAVVEIERLLSLPVPLLPENKMVALKQMVIDQAGSEKSSFERLIDDAIVRFYG